LHARPGGWGGAAEGALDRNLGAPVGANRESPASRGIPIAAPIPASNIGVGTRPQNLSLVSPR
jgi:hypothetical protein